MQVLSVKENDEILIIAPHPDDECIGAGGLIALYPRKITVIVLTDGASGQGNETMEQKRNLRREEFLAEMKMADIKEFRMLDCADSTLMNTSNCLNDINLARFTKIFVPSVHDKHPDHVAAYIHVRNALKKKKICDVNVYLYEVHSHLQMVTHFVDISRVLSKKQALIQCHQSQLKFVPYDRLVSVSAEYWAIQARMKCNYIEVYQQASLTENTENEQSIALTKDLQKSQVFYYLLVHWLAGSINNVSVAELLAKRQIKTVAIYGYAELGKLLCMELDGKGIDVKYIIDQKAHLLITDNIPCYEPHLGLPSVDAVLVTAVMYFPEIKAELLALGFSNILSLQDLVEEMRA